MIDQVDERGGVCINDQDHNFCRRLVPRMFLELSSMRGTSRGGASSCLAFPFASSPPYVRFFVS